MATVQLQDGDDRTWVHLRGEVSRVRNSVEEAGVIWKEFPEVIPVVSKEQLSVVVGGLIETH